MANPEHLKILEKRAGPKQKRRQTTRDKHPCLFSFHSLMIIRCFRSTPALFLVVLILLIAAQMQAQEQVQAPKTEDCRNASTTSAMRACANASYEAAQRELDSAYQNLLRRLDSSQKQKLRVAQKAWLQYRDANAEFQASLAQGGTLAPLIRTTVLAEMTKARASELKNESLP